MDTDVKLFFDINFQLFNLPTVLII